MSKLGQLTGSVVKDKKAINEAINKISGTDESYTKVEYTKIPLNQICYRYKNYYINDVKTFNALRADIAENGLQQPIVVVDINEHLANCEDDNESKYLEKQKDKGCKYFVSSGHRRFQAYISLFLNTNKVTNKDLNNLYANFNALKFGNKYDEIICNILNKDDKETNVYNGTNLTQRPTTNFEFVVAYLEKYKGNLDDRGYLKKIHDDIYVKYGNSISIATISLYVRIFTTFDKKLLELIFSGKLSLRDAVEMVAIYKTIEKNLDNVLDEIENETFKIKKYKPKSNKKKRVSYSQADVYEMLVKIKRNPKELDKYLVQFKK